jgi:hypothetical protein
MRSLARYACCRKEMLGWIHEKMATQESAPGGGKFFASSSTIAGNGASVCNDPCALGEDYSTVVGNGSWDNAHTSNPSSRAESQVLWCNTHNVQMGVWMAKLATLQLVQSVGARSMIGGPINQEARAPTPQGFPHIMLSVKRVKHNM